MGDPTDHPNFDAKRTIARLTRERDEARNLTEVVQALEAERDRLREALERKCIKEDRDGYWCEECHAQSDRVPFPHAEGCICAALRGEEGEGRTPPKRIESIRPEPPHPGWLGES